MINQFFQYAHKMSFGYCQKSFKNGTKMSKKALLDGVFFSSRDLMYLAEIFHEFFESVVVESY